MQFTVMFQNEVSNFADIESSPDGITISRKDSNTGPYVNFTSFVSGTYRTSWIRSLVTHASHICSTDELLSEINTIKIFALWNGFPKSVDNSITNKTLITSSITEDSHDANEISNEVTMVIKVVHWLNPVLAKSNQIAKKKSSVTFRGLVLHDVPKIVPPKRKYQH